MVNILTEQSQSLLLALLFLILPWIVIILGLALNIQNSWYYILSITWFGSGIIFYSALK